MFEKDREIERARSIFSGDDGARERERTVPELMAEMKALVERNAVDDYGAREKEPRRLDLSQISRRTVAERDYWINQLVLEVHHLRSLLAAPTPSEPEKYIPNPKARELAEAIVLSISEGEPSDDAMDAQEGLEKMSLEHLLCIGTPELTEAIERGLDDALFDGVLVSPKVPSFVVNKTTAPMGEPGEEGADIEMYPVVRLYDVEAWAANILPRNTNTENFLKRVRTSALAPKVELVEPGAAREAARREVMEDFLDFYSLSLPGEHDADVEMYLRTRASQPAEEEKL